MGDPKGFLKVKRGEGDVRDQASRCMDCGTPFCHWGCPLANYIPEWNDFMFGDHWQTAFMLLDATNNLPEITGRVCPATCEYACVLEINDDPVTIRENELAIVEHAFGQGWISPNPVKVRSGKKVAVIGSGPAGLACAAQLNKAGHEVTVFERDDKVGGILRYGIPDFKLEKWVLDRRIDIWGKEGIVFKTGVEVGKDYPVEKLREEFDAICFAGGSRVPRDLKIEGRELKGIYFAMDYLTQSNRRIAGERIPEDKLIDAKGKKVVVIGGGDTGADCVGTANRQGAACVVQIEILPKPPECRSDVCPWPTYPLLLKTASSHEEDCERHWSVKTKKFIGENGRIKNLICEKEGSEFKIEADLVILAMGFLRPEPGDLGPGVFLAGDARRGPSLVVWAIAEGREAAEAIDRYLK